MTVIVAHPYILQVVKSLLYTHNDTDKLRSLDGDPESFEVTMHV